MIDIGFTEGSSYPTGASVMIAPDSVNSACLAYRHTAQRWVLIDDLLGGTLRMRQQAAKWLPQSSNESAEDWVSRVGMSVLYEATKDTIDSLGSKPFSRNVTIFGELPEDLDSIERDADLKGTHLTQFLSNTFAEGLKRGPGHILVDYPDVGGQELTIAQERDQNIRPYFVSLSAKDLIGWDYDYPNGVKTLREIRFRETRVVKTGTSWGQQVVDYIRVINRDTWELWKPKEGNSSEYIFDKGGPNTLGEVPLASFFCGEVFDDLLCLPPFEPLAWVNLEHFQTCSQQRWILHWARVPMLQMAGVSSDEMDNKTVLAPNRIHKSKSKDFTASWIEHTGAAIASGQKDIEHLEQRMEVLGTKPMQERLGGPSATSKVIDNQNSKSELQEWVRSLEAATYRALTLAAKWKKKDLITKGDSKVAVDIFNDFGATLKGANDLKDLLAQRMANELDRRTYLEEIKRRGALSEVANIETIMKRLETEPPPISQTGLDNPTTAPAAPKRIKGTKNPSKHGNAD